VTGGRLVWAMAGVAAVGVGVAALRGGEPDGAIQGRRPPSHCLVRMED